MEEAVIDVLRDCYQEQVSQARHHENQRERMTALIVAVATAFVSVISHGEFQIHTLFLAVLLIPIGAFGFAFCRKHYERNRLHTTIARHYLKAIEKQLSSPAEPVSSSYLTDIHKAGRADHKKNFSSQSSRKASATGLRLHTFWNSIHLLIVVLGVLLSALIIGLRFCN